jgi:leucyl aminopeptidase
MNIDILFFDKNLNNKEKFIKDLDAFDEYIKTHKFDSKNKKILLMPGSLSSNGNKTILVSSEDSPKIDYQELGYSIGKNIKDDATIDILNFEGNKEMLTLGIMFSQYQFDTYKSKKSEDNVELTFSDSLDVKSNR